MAFLALVELLTFLFLGYFFGSQILVPLIRGTRFFPFIRRKVTYDELVKTLDEKERVELEAVVTATKKLIEEQRNVSNGGTTDANSK